MHILYVSFVQETLFLGHPLFLSLFSRRRIVSLLSTHTWVSGISKKKIKQNIFRTFSIKKNILAQKYTKLLILLHFCHNSQMIIKHKLISVPNVTLSYLHKNACVVNCAYRPMQNSYRFKVFVDLPCTGATALSVHGNRSYIFSHIRKAMITAMSII